MLKEEQIEFLKNLQKQCIHGKNILAKKDKNQIEKFYGLYSKFHKKITHSKNINEKSNLFINYKKQINKLNKTDNGLIFSPQSKLEPTILEEFLFHLFKSVFDENSLFNLGSVKAYNNLYFSPENLKKFKKNNFIKINEKDQDFSIYKKVNIKDEKQKYELSIPIVSIECKTYLDKTMLEGSIATAEKIKSGNPHCKFYIVTETYEVDFKVDPSTSRIDNIFVLKKGNRNKRDGNIDPEVIIKLYKEVGIHLKSNWFDIKENINKRGTIY